MSLIRNPREVVRAIDFTGVQNGNIHPTDIDCVLEFDNDILILMEVKKWGNKIPTGQRLLLERLCDSWHTERSIVLKVEYIDDMIGAYTINLHQCKVTEFYTKKKWYLDDKETPLVDFINKLGKKWNNERCKFTVHDNI